MADDFNLFTDKAYTLSALEIYDAANKKSLNVINFMVELNIFEDMYSPSLSGNLIVGENFDLITEMPIRGFDFIRVTFSKPGESDIEKVFRIHRIDKIDANMSTQASQVYTVHFCSEELILNNEILVLKSYKGKSITEITRDILLNYLKVDGTSEFAKYRPTYIKDLPQVYDLFVNGMHPFEAINWAVSRSTPSALFFENKKGYQLKTVNNLFGPIDYSVQRYGYGPKNVDLESQLNITASDEMKRELRNMISFEFYDAFNILQGLSGGMFASTLRTIDVVRRKSELLYFNYDDAFKKDKHVDFNKLDINSFSNNLEDRFGKKITERYPALRRYHVTTNEHNTDNVITSKQPNIRPNQVEQWLLQRISRMEQLNYFKVKFVAPGDPIINVGEVIDFEMPKIMSKVPGDKNTQIHPYYSGRYLITAIRHKINIHKYEMIMEGVKDCMYNTMPQADNGDQTINTLRKL